MRARAHLRPDYSVSVNTISDLGTGSSALIFNSSLFLFGVMIVTGAYFIQRAFGSRLFFVLFTLAGVGAILVGLFPCGRAYCSSLVMHSIGAMMTFGFGGLSAIASYKLQKPPLSYISVLLGALALVSLFLFSRGIYLRLGVGGMERMIAYPTILWTVGFGGHLIGYSKDTTTTTKR